MTDRDPPASWQHRVARSRSRRRHHPVFARGTVTVGAIHMAGMIAGLLAADKMQNPGARWSAIAGFGVATGLGEAIWRERVEQQQEERENRERE